MLRCQGQETHVILQSTTIVHAGSVYDKDRCAECANKFIQYKDANMMSSGVEIKICSVAGNHNQGTQTIMLYATKPDMLLEMSTKFMKDHSQFMVKKEQDARQVIHKFYLSIKREDWTLDTMRDLYETVITTTTSPGMSCLDLGGDAGDGLQSDRHARQQVRLDH